MDEDADGVGPLLSYSLLPFLRLVTEAIPEGCQSGVGLVERASTMKMTDDDDVRNKTQKYRCCYKILYVFSVLEKWFFNPISPEYYKN